MPLLIHDFDAADLKHPAFSFRSARSLAALSALAYYEPPFRDALAAQWELELIAEIDEPSSNTQLFIASTAELLIVSFRGTQESQDWIQNLQIRQRPHDIGGESHKGFTSAVDSVWSGPLEDALRGAMGSGKQVYFTGHSLGGALATLLAAKVSVTPGTVQPTAIYTFGQPLVGDRRFVRAFNEFYGHKFYRFRNHKDLVTRIPPKPLYRHTDQRLKFDRDGELIDTLSRESAFETFVEPDDTLDLAEFRAMQQAMDASEESAMEGFFTRWIGLDDHSLVDAYLPILRRHASSEIAVESAHPNAEAFANEDPFETMVTMTQQPDPWILKVREHLQDDDPVAALREAETAREENRPGALEMASGLFDEIRLPLAPDSSPLENLQGPIQPGGILPSGQPRPINSSNFAVLSEEYQAYFDSLVIRSSKLDTVAWYRNRLIRHRDRYTSLEDELGIPWYFIGIIHVLEGNSDFSTHLHNGDPLTHRTVRKPRGRPENGNPPFSWEYSARDALRMKGYHLENDWSIPHMLYRWERYNGFGYRSRYVPTPYLWSFSTHYSRGKFTSDGHFDSDAVSRQVGAAVLLKNLHNNDVSLFT